MRDVGSVTAETTAVQVYSGSAPDGIQLQADADNAGTIYIGKSNVSSTRGYPLKAGKTLFLPGSAINLIYALATEASQKLYYIVP